MSPINATSLENSSAAENDNATSSVATYSLMLGTFLTLLIVIAIVGNVLVCIAVVTERSLRTRANAFIVSLAVADLAMAVLVMTLAVLNDLSASWPLGRTVCDVWLSLDIMGSTASILNLCVISADRYVHIRHPFEYHRNMSTPRVATLIAAVWVLSVLLSFVPIQAGWHGDGPPPGRCLMKLSPLYAVVSTCISFVLPTLVMLAIYVRMFAYARGHVRAIKRTLAADQHRHFRLRDHKAAVTLGVIMGVFLLCWTPFFAINIFGSFCPNKVPVDVVTAFTWLGYTNSALNPAIYSIFNKDFRHAFQRVLSFRSCRAAMPQTARRTYRSSRPAVDNGVALPLKSDADGLTKTTTNT